MATTTAEQLLLLEFLYGRNGAVFLRGDDAAVATSAGMEQLVAIGPTSPSGALPAQITEEGREAFIAANPSLGEEA